MPIRVSFLIDRLSRAGTESQLLALIRVLNRDLIEPSLILLDGTDAESQSLEPDNCEVIRLGVKRLLSREAVQAAWQLRQHWQNRRPDILQLYFLDSAYFGVPLARLLGIPRLVRVRNNLGYWLTPRHRLLNRLIGQFTHQTLTNSDAGRDALRQSEFLPAKRVTVLANGVDLDRFTLGPEPLLQLPSAIVGCVANLRPVKNIDGLLRAIVTVRCQYPGVRLRIAGDGEDRASLEQLRDHLGLHDAVEFVGSVSDVPRFLSAVDLAVLPSHSEGMSNAVLEYMAAARAIVATDVGANAKLLAGCGRIVPPRDEEALAEGIMSMLKGPEFARQQAQAARSRVEQLYSRPAMARAFERFYQELLTRPPNSRQ